MGWFGEEFWWLFEPLDRPSPEQLVIDILRFNHANGKPPNTWHETVAEATRLWRIADMATRLAPFLYNTWCECYGITNKSWKDLSKRHQLVWLERAGRILVNLPVGSR